MVFYLFNVRMNVICLYRAQISADHLAIKSPTDQNNNSINNSNSGNSNSNSDVGSFGTENGYSLRYFARKLFNYSGSGDSHHNGNDNGSCIT